MHIVRGADAAAHGQRHEAVRRGALDHVDHRPPAMGAGGDVEKDHLVGALVVVADREFDGVADIAQPAVLRAAELHPARHFTVVDVETGDDAFREHGENGA